MPGSRLATGLLVVLLWAGGIPAGSAAGDEAVELLSGHDFTAGGYTVLARLWGRERHEIQRELGEFYVDDPAVLEELRNLWVTRGTAPFYACGYHYTVLVLQGQRIVDSFVINLETDCGAVVTAGGSYRFDPTLLTQPAARYRKPVVERREFASLKEGRAYLAGLAGNERLLLAPHPEWRDHDGEFRFKVPCPDHGYEDARVDACLDRLRAEIDAVSGGEAYALSESGSGSDYILVEMKCSKALHSRFDLHEEYFAWRDYKPAVTLYWRQ